MRPYFKAARAIPSGGEAAPAHREPGLGDAAIEQEYEQQHRDGETERRLGESGEDAAQRHGQQDEQSGQGNRQVTHTLCKQADGTEQVVEVEAIAESVPLKYLRGPSTHDGQEGCAAVAFVDAEIGLHDGCVIGLFRMSDCAMKHFPALP